MTPIWVCTGANSLWNSDLNCLTVSSWAIWMSSFKAMFSAMQSNFFMRSSLETAAPSVCWAAGAVRATRIAEAFSLAAAIAGDTLTYMDEARRAAAGPGVATL